MPGPPPSRNPRRRNARPEWRRLPAAGRPGDPPEWPLPTGPTKGEAELWEMLWSSPQAMAWEDLGWFRVVARYTRFAVQAERRTAAAALLSEVRQLEDRLGLSPMAMKRLQWEIDEPAAEEDEPGDVPNIEDYRERIG